MKRLFKILLLIPLIILLFSFSVKAQEIEDIEKELEDFKSTLSEEVRGDMERLGVDDYLKQYQDSLTLSSVLGLITDKLRENSSQPLSVCIILLSIILLCSVLEVYKDSLTRTAMKEVMGAVAVTAVTSALVAPVLSLFESASDVITMTANMMLLYIPVLIALLTFSGKVLSGGGLYATLMTASQNVSLLSSRFITPMLSFMLALSVSSSLSQRVRLNGFCDLMIRFVKWTLVFAMTIFSALVSIKSFVSNTFDSVSSRAVRFSMSSLIPVVGASVSEAYRTITGSVNLLRSGVGVFVIIAAAVAFLPVFLKTVLFLLSVNLCSAVSDAVGCETITGLLLSVSKVLTILTAVIVCVLTVFLVSTAMLISSGENA